MDHFQNCVLSFSNTLDQMVRESDQLSGNVEIVIIVSLAILIIPCFALTVDCYNVLTGSSYNFTAA